MHSGDKNIVAEEGRALVVHYSEIALKRGNRCHFENLLMRNIKTALGSDLLSHILRLHGRLVIFPKSDAGLDEYAGRLAHVFGVANVASSTRVGSSIEEIRAAVLEVTSRRKFNTFAVRARRGDKGFPMNSREVNVIIGAAVQGATGARVDLTSPEFTVRIEITKGHAFIYEGTRDGPGGLPVGSSGRVACLISGGIDSPVAAWRMMKRGCEVSFIHFHSAPFTGPDSQEKVEELVLHLLEGQPRGSLIMVPFGEIQKKIVVAVPNPYRVVMYRRFMLRIACEIAKGEGAMAIVTGESLSQVASQTLGNLTAIDAVATLPIFRPLIGFDKEEIVTEAKKIGTFDISIRPHDDCCSFLVPRHPVTSSSHDELNEVERALDVDALVKIGVNGAVKHSC